MSGFLASSCFFHRFGYRHLADRVAGFELFLFRSRQRRRQNPAIVAHRSEHLIGAGLRHPPFERQPIGPELHIDLQDAGREGRPGDFEPRDPRIGGHQCGVNFAIVFGRELNDCVNLFEAGLWR